jgi:hypothetical protein
MKDFPRERVECEPKNWARDELSFFRFNEHGGYVWCNTHHCWHWIDVPAEEVAS